MLSKLSDEQRKIAEKVYGVHLVSAPPGSGKTFTLQKRILWMVNEHQIPARKILAITFTNKAAAELRERIGEELEDVGITEEVNISTFHSFALRILKELGKETMTGGKFKLIDDDEKVKILKPIIKKFKVDREPKHVAGCINTLKSRGITPKDKLEALNKKGAQIKGFIDDPKSFENTGFYGITIEDLKTEWTMDKEEYEIFNEYENNKKELFLLDFDDLIIRLRDMLKISKIRKKICNQYQFILVDETQDIDPVQEEIIRLMASFTGNLFAIFDCDQAIYSFRNADPKLVVGLKNKLPKSTNLFLTNNYRSTNMIIQAANHLISNNNFRFEKTWMKTDNEIGEKLQFQTLQSKEAEAQWICEKIKTLRKSGIDYKDMAILYRNNELNKTMEQKLLTNEIPYEINKNISFFQRREIKDIMAYLNVIVDKNEFFLERIINSPRRGIGERTVDKLKTQASLSGIPFYNALELSKNDKILSFISFIENLHKKVNSKEHNILTLVDVILEETKYMDQFKADEREKRMENINRFKDIIEKFIDDDEEQSDLLTEIKLLSGEDTGSPLTKGLGKVNLMTMHSSKGLGYDAVFIIGAEQGVIPSSTSMNNDELFEEERRLFYVAITRAKKLCYITNAKYRMGFGNQLKETKRSIFINEIPSDFIDFNFMNSF